jgi:hypothetical protein
MEEIIESKIIVGFVNGKIELARRIFSLWNKKAMSHYVGLLADTKYVDFLNLCWRRRMNR